MIVANHESLIDPFILATLTRRTIHFMAKIELWRFRVVGWLIETLGGFPVERGRGDSNAHGEGLRLLEAGRILGVFPQGTCLPYRRRPYHRGAARLALRTGAPLVPVCLVNTERALRPGRPRVGLPRIRIVVGTPIAVERSRPTVTATRELTHVLEAAIEELRRPYGPPAHAWFDE